MDAATIGLIVAAALGAAGGVGGSWLSRRSTSDTHSQSQAQTVAVDVDKLVELAIAGYRDEVERLKRRVGSLESQVALNRNREAQDQAAIAKLRARVDELSREVELLRAWVRAQGVDPELAVIEAADAWVAPDDGA